MCPEPGRVRWGFLGAGAIARQLAAVLPAAGGAEHVAVAARDVERARRLAAEFGVPRAYGSYADLIADPEVDAVYVALANDQHRPWTVAALEAGKAVLCEKPLGLTAGEVDAMAAAAEAAGRVLVEASWYRWHPRIRRAQAVLAEGAIGRVRHVRAAFAFAGVGPGNFRLDPQRGGGALYDVGCYAVSAALWAVGAGTPATASARSTVGPTGVDLATDAVLTWADGATAGVHAGMAGRDEQVLRVRGERGELVLPGAPFTSWLGLDTEIVVAGRTSQVAAADPYKLMLEEVSAAVRGERAWVVPLAESRATAAVLDACRASALVGGAPVPVAG